MYRQDRMYTYEIVSKTCVVCTFIPSHKMSIYKFYLYLHELLLH